MEQRSVKGGVFPANLCISSNTRKGRSTNAGVAAGPRLGAGDRLEENFELRIEERDILAPEDFGDESPPTSEHMRGDVKGLTGRHVGIEFPGQKEHQPQS